MISHSEGWLAFRMVNRAPLRIRDSPSFEILSYTCPAQTPQWSPERTTAFAPKGSRNPRWHPPTWSKPSRYPRNLEYISLANRRITCWPSHPSWSHTPIRGDHELEKLGARKHDPNRSIQKRAKPMSLSSHSPNSEPLPQWMGKGYPSGRDEHRWRSEDR